MLKEREEKKTIKATRFYLKEQLNVHPFYLKKK